MSAPYRHPALRFLDLHYANAVFFYRKSEGHGERISGFASTMMYSLGFAAILINVIQLFTGSLAPFVRALAPYFDRPHDNAAEYVLAIPLALVINYFSFWARTRYVLEQHAWLEERPVRWALGLGVFFSILFFVAVILGRYNFIVSCIFAGTIALAHAYLWSYILNKMKIEY